MPNGNLAWINEAGELANWKAICDGHTVPYHVRLVQCYVRRLYLKSTRDRECKFKPQLGFLPFSFLLFLLSVVSSNIAVYEAIYCFDSYAPSHYTKLSSHCLGKPVKYPA